MFVARENPGLRKGAGIGECRGFLDGLTEAGRSDLRVKGCDNKNKLRKILAREEFFLSLSTRFAARSVDQTWRRGLGRCSEATMTLEVSTLESGKSARMAESVDALVSNTNDSNVVPVRPRLRVPGKNLKQLYVSCLGFLFCPPCPHFVRIFTEVRKQMKFI